MVWPEIIILTFSEYFNEPAEGNHKGLLTCLVLIYMAHIYLDIIHMAHYNVTKNYQNQSKPTVKNLRTKIVPKIADMSSD